MKSNMPPGQIARDDFPRFGLPAYENRFPSDVDSTSIIVRIVIDGQTEPDEVSFDYRGSNLPRIEQTRDFHCVTTWSHLDLRWEGLRFSDFYAAVVEPRLPAGQAIGGATVHAQDGYKTSLQLADLLAEDVVLADTMNGESLSIEHGAPLRLVMPAHYGYKNVKHLKRIVFYRELPCLKRGISAFLDHPRGRVSFEERGQWFPGWLLRYVYRPLIGRTAKRFAQAMQRYRAD